MSYRSPIDMMCTDTVPKIISDVNEATDKLVIKAVYDVGINVDRDELIRALAYDRNQYQKGYADRSAEINNALDKIDDIVYDHTDDAVYNAIMSQICELFEGKSEVE